MTRTESLQPAAWAFGSLTVLALDDDRTVPGYARGSGSYVGRWSFVGTESQLNIVFELFRQLAFGAETDPDVRLAELHRRRALDEEIAQVSTGHVEVMNATAQRDRYQQFSETARGLAPRLRKRHP